MEPGCIEALVAQPAVEALDVTVLHRATWLMCTSPTFQSSAQPISGDVLWLEAEAERRSRSQNNGLDHLLGRDCALCTAVVHALLGKIAKSQ